LRVLLLEWLFRMPNYTEPSKELFGGSCYLYSLFRDCSVSLPLLSLKKIMGFEKDSLG
jgi:hypothetical protein